MVAPDKPRFNIAICGGGIAGLTLAIALHKYSSLDWPLKVDIFEADPQVRTVGAGITVWPRTWEVMRHLGLSEDLSDVTVKAGASTANQDLSDEFKPAFVARKANQPDEGYHYAKVLAPSGSTAMHRRAMIDVFLRHLPPSYTLHTSKRLVEYTVQDSDNFGPSKPAIVLRFADGTTSTADVLIGADGIHSVVRTCMYGQEHMRACAQPEDGLVPLEECLRVQCSSAIPTWTGITSYRCLIPTEKLYAKYPKHTTASINAILCYSGKGKHIITYQISEGKYLNFVALCRVPGGEGTQYAGKWVTDVPREELVDQFSGWEAEVEQMLEHVENPSRWAIHIVDKLPFAVSRNVTLLGDAMHAMPPNFGAGGGQAIEDAYILGRLLADARVTTSNVHKVLCIYERVRLAFANDISRRARDVGLMYEFNAPGLYDSSSDASEEETRRQLDELGAEIQKMWEWQWKESVEELWVQTEGELNQLLGSDRPRGSEL